MYIYHLKLFNHFSKLQFPTAFVRLPKARTPHFNRLKYILVAFCVLTLFIYSPVKRQRHNKICVYAPVYQVLWLT